MVFQDKVSLLSAGITAMHNHHPVKERLVWGMFEAAEAILEGGVGVG